MSSKCSYNGDKPGKTDFEPRHDVVERIKHLMKDWAGEFKNITTMKLFTTENG